MPRGIPTTGPGPNPSGMCLCGCGQRTAIAKYSDAKRGYVLRTPKPYLKGHSHRKDDGLTNNQRYEARNRARIAETGIDLESYKRCGICSQLKKLSEFHHRAGSRDGMTPACGECNRLRVRRYLEGSAKHREQARARAKAAYHRNPQLHRARARTHQSNAPPLDIAYAKILALDPCAYCGDHEGDTVDHIEPIHYGGSGQASNLTAACEGCNKSKRTTSLLHFLLRCPSLAKLEARHSWSSFLRPSSLPWARSHPARTGSAGPPQD